MQKETLVRSGKDGQVRMVRKARRAFARALGRGPLRPGQIGVAVFSVTFLAAGAVALALVAPPLIQQELDGRQTAVASLFGGSTGAGAGGAEGSAGTQGEPAADGASSAVENGAGATAGAGGSSVGAVSFPVFDFSSVDALVDDAAQSHGGGAAGGSSGAAGGASDNPVENAPAEDAPAGQSEAEEQVWLSYLRQQYDALPAYQQQVSQAYASFPSLALEPSSDVRFGYMSNAIAVRDRVDVALLGMEENRVPDDSRYFNDYLNVKKLYEDLSSAAAILARAWVVNTQFDDPAAHRDAWMSPIEENSSGGKVTYLADYEARYPGARP